MDDRPVAIPDGLELLATPERLDSADPPQLLAALTTLRRLRAYCDQWEPTLVETARARGITWAQIAPALGLASRQAAERRYLRLKPQAADQPGLTRERRVQAARDQRSGDRAVADWARDNAATLRQLAGQITALPSDSTNPSPAEAIPAIDEVRAVLGSNDAAELLQPLTAAGPPLRTSHPGLADQINAITDTTDQIRTADLARRTPQGGSET